jgi:hypothetical protein
MSKSVSLALTLLALIALSSLSSAKTACQSIFSAGSGTFAMQFCVTENGNITQYATPTSSEHFSSQSEGYGVCDNTGDIHGNPVNYYDYAAGGALHWDTATVDQPGGANTFPLTITRNSSDGLWKLVQTFSQSAKDRAVKIRMDLTNNSTIDRQVSILRFADIDANGLTSNDFEASLFSSFAGNQDQVGIQLRDWANVANVPFVLSVPDAPKPCNFAASTVQFSGNGSLGLLYNRTIKAQSSKTVKVQYRPI